MRKYNKALTALLSLLMMVVLSIGMASCTTIEVLMGLFQDSSIKNPIGGGNKGQYSLKNDNNE